MRIAAFLQKLSFLLLLFLLLLIRSNSVSCNNQRDNWNQLRGMLTLDFDAPVGSDGQSAMMNQAERKTSPRRGCTRQRCFTATYRISFVLFFVAYISLGAYLFLALESGETGIPPSEEVRTADDTNDKLQLQEMMTHQLLERLWDITESLNILYKENWTQLAAYEMTKVHSAMLQVEKKKNDCRLSEHSSVMAVTSPVKWNYPMAFLYSLSVITTLGNSSTNWPS